MGVIKAQQEFIIDKDSFRHIFYSSESVCAEHGGNSKFPTNESEDFLLTMRSRKLNIADNAVRSESYALPDARHYLLGAVATPRRAGSLSQRNGHDYA